MPRAIELPALLTGQWAKQVYYTLGLLHDFAYFGYITVQPLIISRVLDQIPALKGQSFVLTVFIISTHLFWQVLFESPTGAYADTRGRMRAVRDHFLVRVACMGVLMLAVWLSETSSADAAVIVVIIVCLLLVESGMALAESLLSGSLDAWLVDTLTESSRKDEIGATFAIAATLFNIAILVAMPLFLFFQLRLELHGASYFVIGVAGVVFLLGALVAHASRNEIYRIGMEWHERSAAAVRVTWLQGLRYVLDDPVVRWAAILKAAPFGTWVVISWFWPLLVTYPSASRDGSTLMVVLALGLAASRVVGSGFSFVLQKLSTPEQGLRHWTLLNLLVALCGGFTLFTISQSSFLDALAASFTATTHGADAPPVNVLPALVFAFALMMAKATEEVVKVFGQIFFAAYIVNDTVRATVLSFSSALTNLIGFLFIGLGAFIVWRDGGNSGPPTLFVVATVAGIALSVLAFVNLRRAAGSPVTEGIIDLAVSPGDGVR